MKQIYLVRHCSASGQEPEAELTPEGAAQAEQLADWFRNIPFDFIVSSPFRRAVDTVKPLGERMNLKIHLDARLQERVLSTAPLIDWMMALEQTYIDHNLKFTGGESSNEAIARGMQVLEEMLVRPEQTMMLVTHGALLSLLIMQFDHHFGFEGWRRLSNPDVFQLEIGDQITIQRIWKS